jgi:spore germination protein YaaH
MQSSYRKIVYLRWLAVSWLVAGLLASSFSFSFGFGFGFEPPQVAQAAPLYRLPLRWGYYVRQPTSMDSVAAHIQNLDILAPYYFVLDGSGQVGGYDQPEITGLARSRGVKVVPMLQNTTTQAELHALLTNPASVTLILNQLDYLVQAYNYYGIHIDFEDLYPGDRPYLTQFMAQLYLKLKPRGKLVTMAVAAKTQETFVDWAGPYDYAGLAPYLDLVTIMTYDYSYSGSPNGPTAPISWVNAASLYAASQFGAEKVLLGVPFYGYDWNLSQHWRGVPQDTPTTLELLQQYQGRVSFDPTSQTPYGEYIQNGDLHRVWFENGQSMQAKMEVVQRNQLGGWAAWRLGQESEDFWPPLATVANPTRPVAAVANTLARLYFPQTGHTLSSLFLKFWQDKGGLEQFGLPWTEEFEERNPFDGKTYLVQYFERARFEYHPESGSVMLGLLGSQLTENRRDEYPFLPRVAIPNSSERIYFAETAHSLGGPFKRYWETYGGLALYGLPISEEFVEINLADGKGYLVQYFERNRFEYHPENAGSKSEVLLGLLGNQLMFQRGWLIRE